MMNKFKIVPLSKAYVDNIKASMTDDFGNPVIEQPATGLGPCRISLKPFEKGVDTRLLFKHSPFDLENAYNQPGPVFINADEVEEYSDVFRFPPLIKANKKSFPLSLIAYTKNQMMALTRLVGDEDVDLMIGDIFEQHQEVEYLHVRNAQACCFICKVERL